MKATESVAAESAIRKMTAFENKTKDDISINQDEEGLSNNEVVNDLPQKIEFRKKELAPIV